MNPNQLFLNRKLIIATKHNKEKVMAPIFEKSLEVKCVVAENFDTDQFGTFTGEIERKLSPYETCKKKCLEAIIHTGHDLAVANEGSFGPDPLNPFLVSDYEIMILIDIKNNLEIKAELWSLNTNFLQKEIKEFEELLAFAKKIGFPDHGLILKNSERNFVEVYKGIQNELALKNGFNNLKKEYGKVYVETDMRAMFNPTRMKVIEELSYKLIKLIESKCPICNLMGFDVVKVKKGLPCRVCLYPSNYTLSVIYQCKQCQFEKEVMYPNHLEFIEPINCEYCNP